MQTATTADSNRTAWLMALVAAAGTTFAPAASAQDEDPIAGMLRSIAQGETPSQDNPLDALANSGYQSEPMTDDELMEALADDVSVDENMIVELHVQDEDLANVLQMLSIQSQRNIVSSRNVAATVTANLYGVTFYEALDAILHVNGYGYVEQGNFIYVYTLEEMATIEQAARLRVAEAIHLNFLNAIDAAEFVTPLLSEGGFIKTNGRTAEFSVGGDTPVGADDYANGAMLVVFDYPENIDEIQRLINEIDTRPAQVLVEATIVQTTLNEANAFGVDFSIVSDLNIGDFLNTGGVLGPVDGLLGGVGQRFQNGSTTSVGVPGDDGRGGAIQSTPGNTSGPSTLKLGIVRDDISVFVRMLDEVSDTTILSSPKILALNRQASRVLVGRKVGYLSTTSTETSTTQTVEFLDTGTQLYFRPFVSDDNMIRMELKPQVSEAIIRNQTDATGAAVTIPDEITNEIVTNVIVPDGHTIVLGGLFRESTSAARRQVPVLGDLPVIGAAFRGHEDETQRSEIIFLIKPSIMADDVLIAQGGRGEDYVRRVRAGSREGLLPWSRERQSSQLLVEAEQLAAEGKIDRALHCVRRALEHNPFQPDAIAMRERLMNEQAVWPTRSLIHDVVENELFDAPVGHTPSGSMSRGSQNTQAAPIQTGASATSSQSFTAPVPVASQPVVTSSYTQPVTQSVTQPTAQSVAQPVAQPVQTPVAVQRSELRPTPIAASTPVAIQSNTGSQLAPTGSFQSTTSQAATTQTTSAPAFQTTQQTAQPTTQQTTASRFSDLRPTPMAANSGATFSQSTSPMAGLTPTLAPTQQAPASTGLLNDPTMKPTGFSGSQSVSQTAPVAQPVSQTPAAPAIDPTASTARIIAAPVATPAASPTASAATTGDAAQAAAEFGLSDSEMQMLVLTEFFRSFGSMSKSTGPFTEVPTETDTPE